MNIITAIKKLVTPKLDTIETNIANIKNNALMSNGTVVKSVQRGVYGGGYFLGATGTVSITLSISAVNPAKCSVHITGGNGGYPIPSGSSILTGSSWPPYVSSLVAGSLTVYRGGMAYANGSQSRTEVDAGHWEVVEFY